MPDYHPNHHLDHHPSPHPDPHPDEQDAEVWSPNEVPPEYLAVMDLRPVPSHPNFQSLIYHAIHNTHNTQYTIHSNQYTEHNTQAAYRARQDVYVYVYTETPRKTQSGFTPALHVHF